jgi:hypothetical protein
MLKTLIALFASLLVGAVIACGGDDDFSALQSQQPDSAGGAQTSNEGSDAGQTSNEGSNAASSGPVGPADMNTIRIGDQVWMRTLPMTRGQCFLYKNDGTLPTSATVWGTLDNDDSLHFSVNYTQEGTFEAQVDNDVELYWVAGERNSEIDDLTIELDFDAQTIRGNGTFTNFVGGGNAQGSFAFQCEEED